LSGARYPAFITNVTKSLAAREAPQYPPRHSEPGESGSEVEGMTEGDGGCGNGENLFHWL